MTPLETALAAVDGHIPAVRELAVDDLLSEAERCADLIATGAETLRVSETKRAKLRRAAGMPLGEGGKYGVEINPDEVVDAVSRGLAILALRQHGVDFAGLHFCDNRHRGQCDRGTLTVTAAQDDRDVSNRGATFTPRLLAEEIVEGTLDAVVYQPGPLQTADQSEWKLLPPKEILGKTTADIACGTGVFLLAAVRYLTARILDQVPPGTYLHGYEQLVREAVISRCVYGVDIDMASVELARVALALLVPTVDIDIQIHRHVRCGDSLLGITSLDQVRWMHLDPAKGRVIHKTQPVPDEWVFGARQEAA